jgi:hypothetical protein
LQASDLGFWIEIAQRQPSFEQVAVDIGGLLSAAVIRPPGHCNRKSLSDSQPTGRFMRVDSDNKGLPNRSWSVQLKIFSVAHGGLLRMTWDHCIDVSGVNFESDALPPSS